MELLPWLKQKRKKKKERERSRRKSVEPQVIFVKIRTVGPIKSVREINIVKIEASLPGSPPPPPSEESKSKTCVH